MRIPGILIPPPKSLSCLKVHWGVTDYCFKVVQWTAFVSGLYVANKTTHSVALGTLTAVLGLVLILLLAQGVHVLVGHHLDRINNRPGWLVRLLEIALASILLFVFIYGFILMWTAVINGFIAAGSGR
jgi:hypothetical protein